MYYKFDKKDLKYVRVNWVSTGLKIMTGVFVISMIFAFNFKRENKEKYTEEEVVIFTAKQNLFSEEKLINEIKGLNFKFPHIVYAQSLLETGKFTSPLFKENNNLFGMKEAVVRLTTSLGTEDGHAIYKTWKESLTDYALYCATYLNSLDTEDDYIGYLSQKYAKDPEYGKKIRNLIETEKLKQIFR